MGTLLCEFALATVEDGLDYAEAEFKCGWEADPPQVFIDRREVSPREVTQTLIVCGDCAGDDPNPVKTLLTKKGCCASCGGSSYVLASIHAAHIMASKLFEQYRRQTV